MTIYLYVKTHNKTGLKYLGQTSSKDPHKYAGSGIYWKSHLNKHGYDYTTEILKECSSKEEIKILGTYYSKLWNIIESEEWANLKIEQGDGGRQSEEVRKKISQKGKGRVPWNKGKKIWSDEEKLLIGERNKKRGPQSKDTIDKRAKKNTGKKRNDEQKRKMSIAQTSRTYVISNDTKKKMSKAKIGNIPWNKGKTLNYSSHNAKKWLIQNIKDNISFYSCSLRKWCLENNISYQMLHRAYKQNKSYNNYVVYEIV